MTLDEARKLHASMTTTDKLDEIAAHACGSAVVAIAALEALGVALEYIDAERLKARELVADNQRIVETADRWIARNAELERRLANVRRAAEPAPKLTIKIVGGAVDWETARRLVLTAAAEQAEKKGGA
jgi:hypothetical protein